MSAGASRRIRVKVCGLTRTEDVAAAAAAGASFLGLVFHPASPRAVTAERARELALGAPVGTAKVALLVDPDDATLDALTGSVPLDMVQLHGRETPERVASIRARAGLPIIKAVGVRTAEDLPALDAAAEVADMVLVDAKPPQGADRPGGHGLPFDWRLIANRRWPVPWFLAGGLTPGNVADAIALTGATHVDVSSGVEQAPGEKDADKIAAFVAAAEGKRRCPTI